MITTSATELDIIEVSASQNPGDACPSFQITVKPHLGTGMSAATHLAWTPPASITFTIDGLTWDCVPLDVPIRVTASEVTYTARYYPRIMHLLRRAKLKKPAVWVSAPEWEQNLYLKDINREAYHVFTEVSDVYASNGWTIQKIFSSLSTLTGYNVIANFPTLHVSQKSIMCDENTAILDFIGSLLPSGFRFTWHIRPDAIVIALTAPPIATAFAVPAGCFAVEQVTPALETYDSVCITGAPYKLSTNLSLGGGLGSSKSLVTAPPAYEETLPAESGEANDQPTTTTRTRTVQPDPFNAPFAVPAETESLFVKNAPEQVTTTATTYENADPVLYETPRVIETVKTVSGQATTLAQTTVLQNDAIYLTNKLQILTNAEYQALTPKPTVLLSAYPSWTESIETVTDTKRYIAPETASKTWPEGCEIGNSQEAVVKGYTVNSRFFKANQTASAMLQDIAAMLQQTGKKSITTFAAATLPLTAVSRTLSLQAAGAYRFEEKKQVLDQVTGKMQTTSAMLPVNSDPPSSPTRWRTAPLTAILDKTSAAGLLVFRLSASVPTSNPVDFELWAKRLFVDMTMPRRVFSVTAPRLIPCGALVGGGMVTGWSASQRGNIFSATMTVE